MGDSKVVFEKLNEIMNEAMENKEPLIKFWIGNSLEVVALDTEAVKRIYDSTTEIEKGTSYDFFSEWLGRGLITSGGQKWKHRRRLLTPMFHFSMLNKYFEAYNQEASILVNKFKKFSETGEEIDIFAYIKRAALDMICETAMGVKVNAQDNHDHEYIKAVQHFNYLGTIYDKNVFFWFKPFYYLSGQGFDRDRTLNVLKKFTSDVIKKKSEEFERKNGELKEKTFLSHLLELKKANNLTEEDIREEVETFMFAGHDTTSSCLAFLFWSIATVPEVQEKIYEEVYEIFGDEERDVSPEDLSKLTYSEMVIKETLRRHPVIPYFGRELQNEVEVCGKILPKGTVFVFAPQHLNFNPHIFEDPYKFDPDRFLPENVSKRDPYDFTPFSAGPRNCIGQKFAMNEIKVILVWVIRKFKLTSSKPFDFVEHAPEVVLRPRNGIPIIFQQRL
uniref:Cytochrome P450 n=1 Tax=Strongyloides papillosus TaxID=174720 RepID=A0A0N5BE60_STREA